MDGLDGDALSHKDLEHLNNTINYFEFIAICRTSHTKKVEYTFFSSANRTFINIDPILVHKTISNKFKMIQVIQTIFSNDMELN